MPRKFNRRSRNACTATSLAALSMAGCKPAGPCRRLRQRQAAELLGIGGPEIQACRPGPDPGILHRRRFARATPARGRSGCACPASPAAPAPSRRRTRPASARCSADARRSRPARGGRPNSKQASMSSRPLFISVAESTEILRPMHPVRMRAGLLGRDARRAPRAASRGTGRRRRSAACAARPAGASPARVPCGRHWKMALCSLSIGSSVGPGGAHRCHQQRPGHHEGFLVGEQQPLAGARGGERRAQTGGADDRRHDALRPRGSARQISSSASAPASTRVPAPGCPAGAARARAAAVASASAA